MHEIPEQKMDVALTFPPVSNFDNPISTRFQRSDSPAHPVRPSPLPDLPAQFQ